MAPRASKQAQKTLTQRVQEIVQTAQTLVVETPEQCVEASAVLREAAILRRDIVKEYKAKREPLLKQQRAIVKEERSFTDQLEAAEAAIEKLIKAVRDKEAAERAAKEQAEREKREAAARAEANLRAEQLRAAAAAAPSKAVAKKLEALAEQTANAQPIIDPIQADEAPQVLGDGVHSRKSYHAAVDDLEKLVLQVAAGIMLARYAGSANAVVKAYLGAFNPNAQATLAVLQPAMPKLNDLAGTFPTDLELAGVRVVEDETFVARR